MSQQWNANLYDSKHNYVAQYGEDVMGLLAPQAGEHILDLGCGTGHLTAKIAESGAQVIGLDSSPDMIEQAKAAYSHMEFLVGDGANFRFEQPFDAVFSNAALHWMPQAEAVAASVWQALKPGGRFVAEFGGKSNIGRIVEALKHSLDEAGYPPPPEFWYFPSLGEYASLLEKQGFRVVYAVHFDRLTPLEDEDGMRNWIAMFGNGLLAYVSEEAKEAVIDSAERRLRHSLYRDGIWYADYVRLRMVALREA
jgi:trans-aconitate methyltransferase